MTDDIKKELEETENEILKLGEAERYQLYNGIACEAGWESFHTMDELNDVLEYTEPIRIIKLAYRNDIDLNDEYFVFDDMENDKIYTYAKLEDVDEDIRFYADNMAEYLVYENKSVKEMLA